MRILQINTKDIGGGAEAIARSLVLLQRESGNEAYFAVGHLTSNLAVSIEVPNRVEIQKKPWHQTMTRFSEFFSAGSAGNRFFRRFSNPRRLLNRFLGREDFYFPGTQKLLGEIDGKFDMIHAHNLHGDYFDLRVLSDLSRRAPLLITLHDMWLATGHCAYSLDCTRWKTGCGHCPNLMTYPAVKRDATRYNHHRKRWIYQSSYLYLASPSNYLLEIFKDSIVWPAVCKSKVIHNGIDLDVFQPADQRMVRAALGLETDAFILLFVANRFKTNLYKDYGTLRATIETLAAKRPGQKLIAIALGDDSQIEIIGGVEVRCIPYTKSMEDLARYYQAADVYVHAAQADNFPTTILEAMACGLPVVATAVGGIVEQVQDGKTGYLAGPKNAEQMAEAILKLMNAPALRQEMGCRAADIAQKCYNRNDMVINYLDYYHEIVEDWKEKRDN